MDIGDGRASFEDMQQALLKFGFRAIGISASYDQLAKLNRPGIVYLENREGGHFSVLTGNQRIDRVADRSFTREPHLQSRTEATENAELKGKVLLVYPTDGEARTERGFFTQSPKRQTDLVVQRIQALPDRIAPSVH